MISMMMSNGYELERKSQVSDRFPTFELETPDEEAGIPVDMVVDRTEMGSGRLDEGNSSSDLVVEEEEEEEEEEELEKNVEKTMVSDELHYSGGGGGDKGFDVKRGTEEEVRSFLEVGSGEMEESRVYGINEDEGNRRRNNCFAETSTAEEERVWDCSGETMGDNKITVSDFNVAYSRGDEGSVVARRNEAFGSEAARALSYGFEPGDMVWGRVKSHPWWPGYIFNEAFATPSVRRTKREGHLLVAFFGDSSYGWFDMGELVPFEPHYAEKSQQTNSRIFVKAVDEARRRAALGLTCYCRNPFNFRPKTSQGYFSVDVVDFEPGGLYSVKQIKKARENFLPSEALLFVQQLAMKPRNNEERGVDWIKNVSLFIAYRKATFEEFDETYAQAFGVQPMRPSHDSIALSDQLAKLSSRAPLSGPVVSAEALGKVKSSAKPSKVKDQSKKDKYVLKRREKSNESKTKRFNQSHVGLAAPSAYEEGAAVMAPRDYVFQKRTPAVSMNPQVPAGHKEIQTISKGNATLVSEETQQEAESNMVNEKINMDQFDLPAGSSVGLPMIQLAASSNNSAVQGGPECGNICIGTNMDVLPDMNGRMTSLQEAVPTSTCLDGSVVFGKLEHPAIAYSFGHEKESKVVDLKWKKSAKICERPEELDSDKTGVGGKKKKRKKKVVSEGISEHLEKPFKNVKDIESLRKSAGKSTATGLVLGENSSVGPQRKQDTSSFLSNSALLPKVDLGNNELEPPELVTDLLALALDPFHGVERNCPEILQHVFLQFQSLVYQKGLVLVPASDAEASEFSDSKTPAGPSIPPSGNVATDPHPKQPKSLARPDDPTKSGWKRSSSERQEEKSAKRLKKLKDLKSLSTEKKAGSQKAPEEKLVEKKEVAMFPSMLKKPDTVKRQAPPVRVAEPMMLSMKFPPRTTLPSVPELKAKFARFGPLDPTAFRVFWKSSTCRVVFKYKSHAQAAYRFAMQNKGFFGLVNVNYLLKDVAAQPPAVSESAKRQADDAFGDVHPFRSEVGEQRRRPPQPSPIQLKSCLKKPLSGGDTSSVLSVPRKNPRVQFILGGEESSNGSRGEHLLSSTVAKVGASSSSSSSTHAMDVNRTNFQKVIPSALPPLLPLPTRNLDFHHESCGNSSTHYAEAPRQNFNQVEEQKKPSNCTSIPTSTPTTSGNNNNNHHSIHISSQMLSLMMRCNDIIMALKASLGYIPYHPL